MKRLHTWILRAAQRALLATLIVGCSIGVAGAWLLSRDQRAIHEEERLRARHLALVETIAATQQRIGEVEASIPPEQEKLLRAEKVVAELRQLAGTWEWLGGNREQRKLNAERLARMETMHSDLAAGVSAKQEEVRRLRWERDGYEMEKGRIESQLRFGEAEKASEGYRLWRAWRQVRGWIVIAAAVYLLGPVLVLAGFRRWRASRAAAL